MADKLFSAQTGGFAIPNRRVPMAGKRLAGQMRWSAIPDKRFRRGNSSLPMANSGAGMADQPFWWDGRHW
ncbi:hypothetical protein ACVWYF_002250 [Hymenobacter sp. UYAg731]